MTITTIIKSELETKVNEEIVNKPNTVKNYLVDTTAAWMFYTPIMAASEYLAADMETEEIMKSRMFAMGVHALVMRPYGKFREKWAEYWNTDKESSKLKKFVVDTTASVMYQIPVYSAILYAAGASLEEASVALPTGLAIGAATGRPYGFFLDKWRKVWNSKSVMG